MGPPPIDVTTVKKNGVAGPLCGLSLPHAGGAARGRFLFVFPEPLGMSIPKAHFTVLK